MKLQTVVGLVVSCSFLAFGSVMALGAGRETPQVQTSWSALAPAPSKKEIAQARIDSNTIAAYEKLGATPGRCLPIGEQLLPKELHDLDSTLFLPGVPEDDTLLVFRFEQAPHINKHETFIDPKAPFGIDFGKTPLTDDVCKELAKLSSLEVLKFEPSKVTATGYSPN